MKSIYCDLDINMSQDLSIQNRRLSSSNVLQVEENDDTTEKRDKRKSLISDNGTSIIHNSIQSFILPPEYTEEQIGNHYGNCIKLASENKINSKNAFSLHLIDYLCEYVKELHHFKMVGSSLDAGTKIYAGRVDSIHQNTYQVLTGLGNPNEEKSFADENISTENIMFDLEAKMKKNKRKNNPIKSTISQNLKKIRINPSQIRSEVDPLFQSQAENFDEGGNCELRCNNLRLLDKTFDLLLDSEKIIYTNFNEDKLPLKTVEKTWFDLSKFNNSLSEIRFSPIPFSEQFADFIFTGWNATNETMNSSTAESFRNMIQNASKLQEQPLIENVMDFQPMSVSCDYSYVNNDVIDHDDLMEDEINDNDDDNSVTIGCNKSDSGIENVMLTNVRGLVNSLVDHYGEMNDKMLGMWAGPLYWKQKAKPIKLFKPDQEKKTAVNIKPNKEVTPIFPDKIATKLNKNGIARMSLEFDWKFSKNDKLSTQLTEVCLNKNIQKDYLLPPRSQFSIKSIHQMMNREVSLINKVLKEHTDNFPFPDQYDDNKIVNSTSDNIDDLVEFGAKSASVIADNDGNITVNKYGLNNDNEYGDNDDDGFSDADAYMGTSYQNIDFNDLDPVTANIKRNEEIDIDYAKTAKRINVKKLKLEMWLALKNRIDSVSLATVNEKHYPNLHKCSKTCLFSDLIIDVDSKVSSEASKDLSVSILLTCLLHLSNEYGLCISNNDNYSDLIIGQGYSHYDIQQIQLYGKGNHLSNESLKRKSNSQSEKNTKRQQCINIFDDSDDSDD